MGKYTPRMRVKKKKKKSLNLLCIPSQLFQVVSILTYLGTNTSSCSRQDLLCKSQSQFLVLRIQRQPMFLFVCLLCFSLLSSFERTLAALASVLRKVTAFFSLILMKGDKHTALFLLKLLLGTFPWPHADILS